MKIKEQAIKDMDALKPSDMLVVYDLILSLKGRVSRKAITAPSTYKKVREVLKDCKGSMSEDILRFREDRI